MFGITKIMNSCPIINIEPGHATIKGYGIMGSSAVKDIYDRNCQLTKLEKIELGGYACGSERMSVFSDKTRWKILHITFDENKQDAASNEVHHLAWLIQQELNNTQE